MRYAADTSVSADRSRNEIEGTLKRYGASHFYYGTSPDKAVVAFAANKHRVRFDLPMPHESDLAKSPKGRTRKASAIRVALEQATRQRWRALLLVIKAKLEAVESGITTFEEEFMAHIVLPNGSTVGEQLLPQMEVMVASGKRGPLKLGFEGD
jgi:hypothetical protein